MFHTPHQMKSAQESAQPTMERRRLPRVEMWISSSSKHLIGLEDLFPQARLLKHRRGQRGYAMAGLLVAVGAIGILISVALPVWSQNAKREREAELVFRGEQYARAIELYQRQYVGAYPPDLETLVEQRFLRRLYRDPMTEDGVFRAVYRSQVDELQGNVPAADRPGNQPEPSPETATPGESIVFDQDADQSGGVVGVVSQSEEESLRVYNGRRKYSEWVFLHVTDRMDAGAGAVNDDVDFQPSQGGARDPMGGDRIRFDRRGQSEPGGNPASVGGGNRP